MPISKPLLPILLVLSLAATTFAEVQPTATVATLPTVAVVDQPEPALSGTSTLNEAVLSRLPQKNSSLQEQLTLLPRVQVGEGQRTSENAGEILPPRISISGGRAYENLVTVDGADLGSLLDPLADNEAAIHQVPGHPQRTFIDPDLIDSVTVYDSNIPARYGHFVGGVVDAQTRLPDDQFSAHLKLRTTRDGWTETHIDSSEQQEFDNSNTFSLQPRFEKYEYGMEIDLPLNEDSGVLLAARQLRSRLKLNHFGDWQSYDKTLDSYLIKYAWTPTGAQTFSASLSHTPSSEEFFLKNTKESDFTIKRGGTSLNSHFNGELPFARYEFSATYLTNRNSRRAPGSFYAWRNTPQRNWGDELGLARSNQGGFGDITLDEQSLQLRGELLLDSASTGLLQHQLTLGTEYAWDQGSYDRQENAYVHNQTVLSSEVVCAEGDSACVSGEQYFNKRNVYPAEEQEADINSLAVYLEDRIDLGPLALRPGLRLSHDDFLDNTDLAYRFAAHWNMSSRHKIRLTGGTNRYYGSALLTYKLREAIAPYQREVRTFDELTGQLSSWAFDSLASVTLDRYSDLDTPYSDEWTVGFLAELFGGNLELNYVERRNRDQFAREKITDNSDSTNYYILNNNGSSDYASVKLAWQRQWQNHQLLVNYNWSDQQASNESYDDTIDREDLDQRVWYDGAATAKGGLPRSDYLREHTFNAIYVGQLPAGFTMTAVASYLSGYLDVVNARLSDEEKLAQGIPAEFDVYEEEQQPGHWTFDWRLDWERLIVAGQLLTISLEVDNLFDRTPPVAGEQTVYALGRQFWLGASYSF